MDNATDDDVHCIVDECERLFCNTLRAAFSGERNLSEWCLPLTMRASGNTAAIPTPPPVSNSVTSRPGLVALPASPETSFSSGSPTALPNVRVVAQAPNEAPVSITPRGSYDGTETPRILMMLNAHFYPRQTCSVRGFVAEYAGRRNLFFFLDMTAVPVLNNDQYVVYPLPFLFLF